MIKTPKGLYVRSGSGRIYAVSSGNEFNSSAWSSEQLPMPPSAQQSSPSMYSAVDSPSSLLDPWAGRNSLHNSMPYSCNMPGVGSVLNSDPYSARFSPQFSSGLAGSIPSTDASDDFGSCDPTSFLNVSDSGNFAWNSAVGPRGMRSGLVSDEVSGGGNAERPLAWMEQQVYRNSSTGLPANSPPHQSSCSYSDLPSDLLCIDATSNNSLDMSDLTLPALTVSGDSDGLNTLSLDDYGDGFALTSSSSGLDPVFGDYPSSPLYNVHSDVAATATSMFSVTAAAAATVDGLDEGPDFSASATDFSELSALMNDNDY